MLIYYGHCTPRDKVLPGVTTCYLHHNRRGFLPVLINLLS